jgi:hypothetical protein
LGERQDAIREFKTVLQLNPMDEWASASLSAIEQGPEMPAGEPPQKAIPETPLPQQNSFFTGNSIDQRRIPTLGEQEIDAKLTFAGPKKRKPVDRILWKLSGNWIARETLRQFRDRRERVHGKPHQK